MFYLSKSSLPQVAWEKGFDVVVIVVVLPFRISACAFKRGNANHM
jgi:hypothetical protein